MEYYIILGQPKEILAGYAKITGTSPMMPKWSLGFSNFEWNINEDELNNMVDTYRAKISRIDAYALDYDWKSMAKIIMVNSHGTPIIFRVRRQLPLKNEMDEKELNLLALQSRAL